MRYWRRRSPIKATRWRAFEQTPLGSVRPSSIVDRGCVSSQHGVALLLVERGRSSGLCNAFICLAVCCKAVRMDGCLTDADGCWHASEEAGAFYTFMFCGGATNE